MPTLLLGDYVGIEHWSSAMLAKEYEVSPETVDAFDVLAAAYWPGDYCGSGWLLLRRKVDGALFENTASHCSCYGVEGQWEPSPSTVVYLSSDQFPMRVEGRKNLGSDAPTDAECVSIRQLAEQLAAGGG